jgi:Holliday junction resolvase RusA-like endonuclease
MTPILHVRIPGEPVAQERHRFGGSPKQKRWHNYDPNAKDKRNFQWELKAAVPHLVPVKEKRLAIIIEIWSGKKAVERLIKVPGSRKRKRSGKFHYQTDWDNYGKFYCDALKEFAWDDDCWIEDGRVIVHRNALEPAVEILVWELAEKDYDSSAQMVPPVNSAVGSQKEKL